MGARRACVVILRLVAPFFALSFLVSGCQMATMATKEKLAQYAGAVDASGLDQPFTEEALKANICRPNGWHILRLQKTPLYTHRQWRSPSRRTAVGVTYIRLPLPLSTKALVWLAGDEVSKRMNGGKLLRRWTDHLGREWFEAETPKYHMTGYVMTRGLDAWINYAGYRVTEPMEPAEIDLARRALDTVLPSSAAPTAQAASAAPPSPSL